MGMSKTEVNFRRLLAAAPQQQNHSKLVHYVATLRELLEKLAEEKTPEGLPRVSKAVVNDYSAKIEEIASKPDIKVPQEPGTRNSFKQSPNSDAESHMPSSPGLRRRAVPTSSIKDRTQDITEAHTSAPVKLDAAAEAHIQKHRKLQEDLTDEMVGLARQLKERSLMMSQSLENTEKILDSTEKAVERSLASTGHANVRAMKIYSETSKTTCFQWLLIFAMTCIFIMVVLLIRVT
ncbi:Ca2+ antiporter/cation exchanger isoform 4 [Theobroma cacao]|uniref:Ca2+ antiporter/cation exchanger isoform 4 n=1 Tax=Theobroma cacao TaxID=3641 RepID=A0A061GTY2_THECC|nr:Ca2+ antiporter/cation exchanger isoform 4 [Theobroma cacao]